jgi:hypothetical protein
MQVASEKDGGTCSGSYGHSDQYAIAEMMVRGRISAADNRHFGYKSTLGSGHIGTNRHICVGRIIVSNDDAGLKRFLLDGHGWRSGNRLLHCILLRGNW